LARIRLKYVNSFRNPDRKNGTVRHYFRKRGLKDIPLPGLPGNEEFMAAYHMALAGMSGAARPDIGASRTAPGTIDALVVSYYRSDAWLHDLEEETRKTRRRIIERFRERHGSKRVALLRREHVEKMLAELDKASAKRHWLKAIRPLLRHAVPIMLREDPTLGVAAPKLPKSRGYHSWADAEIAAYRAHWPCGTQQRLVFEFTLETVSRRTELVRLGRQHVANGWIRIERIKGSEDVHIPLTPDLMAAIDAMPRTDLTFIVTASGKPRSRFGLGNDFAQWAREAGLPDRCRLHGLKKAGMRRAAEDGGTAHELMSLSGHRTLSEVQRYTKGADNKRLADSLMAKRRGRSGNTDVTNAEAPATQTAASALE
jgi:site-specific recombinase XerD